MNTNNTIDLDALRASQSTYFAKTRDKKNRELTRNLEMMRLRFEDGLSLSAIGKKYGVSRQRVQQITSVKI